MSEEKRPLSGPSRPLREPLPIELPKFPSTTQFAETDLVSQYRAISESLAWCQSYSATLFGLEPQDYPRNFDHEDEKRAAQNDKPHIPPVYKVLTENRIRIAIWERECGLRELGPSRRSWLEVLDEMSGNGLRRLVAGAFLNLRKIAQNAMESLTVNSVALGQKDRVAELQVLAACHQLDIGVTELAELQPLIQIFRAEMVEGSPEGPLARLKSRLVSLQSCSRPSILLRRDKTNDQPLDEPGHLARSLAWQIWKDIQSIRQSLPFFLRPLRQTTPTMVLSDGQNLSFNVLKRASLQILLLMLHFFGVTISPLLLLYPLWLGLLILVGLGTAHNGLCGLLNERFDFPVFSGGTNTGARKSHEAWIVLPRLGTSQHELEYTLHHLSTVFRRQMMGIPSQTYGILPDLIRELLLRNTAYETPMTQEIHEALYHVQHELADPYRSKVILIAYSSGAVHANILVNLLLQRGFQHLLPKLEIYTFGGSFYRFGNPPINQDPFYGRGRREASCSTAPGDTGVTGRKCVSHIEHFANADDPFALMGVLDKSNWSTISGDIFRLPSEDSEYKDQAGGYLLNKGYLDPLFPIVGERPSMYSSMAQLPVVMASGADPEDTGKGQDRKYSPCQQGNGRSLKDLSRLYQYIDGREPRTADAPSIQPLHE